MEKAPLKEVIVPNRLEAAVYFVASLLFLIGTNIGTISNRFFSDPVLRGTLTTRDYLAQLDAISNIKIINTLVIVIFWSGIGLIAYTIVWMALNAFIEARNEVVIEQEYVNKGVFSDRLRLPLLQLGLAVSLFAYLIINAKYILPWLVQAFGRTLLLGEGIGYASLLAPTAVMAVNIYVLVTLTRLVFRAD